MTTTAPVAASGAGTLTDTQPEVTTTAPATSQSAGSGTLDLLTVADLQDYSAGGESTIWNAQQKSIDECMDRRGFDYVPLPAVDRTALRETVRSPFEIDAATAAAVGYHTNLLPGAPELLREQDQAAASNQASIEQSSAFGEALEGDDGCAKTAEFEVFGPDGSALNAMRDLFRDAGGEVNARMMASDRITGSMSAWSECMAAEGYDYPRPAAVPPNFIDSPEPSETEKVVASADVRCREQSGYDRVLAEEQDTALRQWIEERPTFLAELDAAKEADEAAAEHFLSG